MSFDNFIQELHATIEKEAKDLTQDSRQPKQGLFQKSWWYKKVLAWTMKQTDFKARLFRFIDVLPNLKTPASINSHFQEYFKQDEFSLLFAGAKLGNLSPKLMSMTIKKQVYDMARIFITGDTLQDSFKKISELRKQQSRFYY